LKTEGEGNVLRGSILITVHILPYLFKAPPSITDILIG